MTNLSNLSVPSELKRRLLQLEDRLGDPCAAAGRVEAVHELRVDLKQWRSALRLLQSVDQGLAYREIWPPFKPVFRTSGRIRFWQIQRRLTGRTAALSAGFAEGYRRLIRDHLVEAREGFNAAVSARNWPRWTSIAPSLRKASREAARKVPGTGRPHALRAYFDSLNEQMAEIRRGLSRRRRSDMHELRKQLREYRDNRGLVIEFLHFDPGPGSAVPRRMDAFHSLLGQWHDHNAAARQLKLDLRQLEREPRVRAWPADSLREGRLVRQEWQTRERALWERAEAELERV